MRVAWARALVRGGDILVGVLWAAGAVVFCLTPGPMLVAKVDGVLPESVVIRAVALGTVAGAEAALAVWLIAGGGARGRMASVALLVVLTAVLVVVGIKRGWAVRCGCLGGVVESGIVQAIGRNVIAGCVVVVAESVDRRRRRVL